MRALRVAAYVLLFAAGLALYTFTLHSDVQAADSGELQLVAIKLGVAHPPGYPLFSVLGWLFSLLPFGSPYARVSLLSAVASAAALPVLARAVALTADADAKTPVVLLPGLAAAAVLATSTTFWAQATTTNIRSLTALFSALLVLCAARAFAGKPALAWFALAFGLGVAHHPSLVFPGAVLGAYVLWRDYKTHPATIKRQLGRAALVVLATQLIWLYLPLRDAAGAPLAPGNLTTLNGFLDHVLARGFGGDMLYFVNVEPARFWDRIALLPMLLNIQFSTAVLVIVSLAIVVALLRRTGLAATLLIAALVHLFITLTYRAPQTVEYAMPSWVIACALLGLGIASLRTWRLPATVPKHGLVVAVALFAIGTAALDGFIRLPNFTRAAADRSVRADAESVLRHAQSGDTILGQWHQITPLWALQQIDGIQPAVRVDYVAPNGVQPYEDTVALRGLAASKTLSPTYVTSYFEDAYRSAGLQALPLSNAPAWRIAPVIHMSDGPGTVTFDGRIVVSAPVGLNAQIVELGQSVPIDIWWQVRGAHVEGESVTVRILRRDGRLAATADVRLTGEDTLGAFAFRRRMLAVPLDLEPGDYDVLVGAYRAANGAITQFADAGGAQFVRRATLTVTPARQPAATQRPTLRECVSPCAQPHLIGVDYDLGVPNRIRLWTHWKLGVNAQTVTISSAAGQAVAAPRRLAAAVGDAQYASLAFEIPVERNLRVQLGGQMLLLPDYGAGERYVPFGNQMALIGVAFQHGLVDSSVDLTWLGARPITNDYAVSVRLYGNRLSAAHDGVPALGAVPTLKWLRGMRIIDRHPLRTDDTSGLIQGAVIVYDTVTRLPLAPLDERYENGFVFVARP